MGFEHLSWQSCFKIDMEFHALLSCYIFSWFSSRQPMATLLKQLFLDMVYVDLLDKLWVSITKGYFQMAKNLILCCSFVNQKQNVLSLWVQNLLQHMCLENGIMQMKEWVVSQITCSDDYVYKVAWKLNANINLMYLVILTDIM